MDMPRRKGKFIVFEGPDGSGTTTQVERISKRLKGEGWSNQVFTTAEPTNGPVGELIRRMLKREIPPLDWRGMSFLFMADRLHHVKNTILPLLYLGADVLCDRYYPSTLVYQSVNEHVIRGYHRMRALLSDMDGTNLCSDDVMDLQLTSTFIQPDLFLFFDSDAEVLRERRRIRGQAEELYEKEEIQDTILALYRVWFVDPFFPGKKEIIDSRRSMEEVEGECWSVIRPLYRVT